MKRSDYNLCNLISRYSFLLLGGLLLIFATTPIFAQSGGSYDLSWWTADSGGGISSGSSYTLSGTVGQPDAGNASGASYILVGGFWVEGSLGGAPGSSNAYLPVILHE